MSFFVCLCSGEMKACTVSLRQIGEQTQRQQRTHIDTISMNTKLFSLDIKVNKVTVDQTLNIPSVMFTLSL